MHNSNSLQFFYNKEYINKEEIKLPSSKSICNRLLIIKALCNNGFDIDNLSLADDSQLLNNILTTISSNTNPDFAQIINTKNAGTVFRFLLAFLAVDKNKYVLTGDDRMLQRPVLSLVEALQNMGADLKYMEKEGFPPIIIGEFSLLCNQIEIDSTVSSQFVSALLLIAPAFSRDFQIKLKGKVVSKPYIGMTISLMAQFGVKCVWKEDTIYIYRGSYSATSAIYNVEADWSAASYFYQIVALGLKSSVFIKGLNKDSIQGDAVVAEIYKSFGVETNYVEEGILLNKTSKYVDNFEFEFSNYPDLVPAIAVTCAALGINARLSGLRNLKIKESDRITALATELSKLNVDTKVENDDIIYIYKSELKYTDAIQTYNDHRIAMCFAPLAMFLPGITILNPSVVEKSFPDYFIQLKKLGFEAK